MDPNEIAKMHQLEDDHWWFQGKKYLIETILDQTYIPPGRFLDIGCGTGVFLRTLEKRGTAYGLDLSEQALSYCQRDGCRLLVRAAGGGLPFKDNSFSLVTLLDMIEHVDNDSEVLRGAYRICRPGGVVVVTVPAFSFLWGRHDDAHHHKKRYVRTQLRDIGISAGFTLEKLTYTNFFIFVPVLLRRIISRKASSSKESDLRHTPKLINETLKWIYRLEAFYLKKADFPWGVSLLMILRKPR